MDKKEKKQSICPECGRPIKGAKYYKGNIHDWTHFECLDIGVHKKKK